MRSRQVRLVVFAVMVTLFASALPEASAGEPSDPPRPLRWQIDPDGGGPIVAGTEVEGSSTKLFRDAEGVSFEIVTTGLQPNHAYTVWFFSYDNPEACVFGEATEGRRCSVRDLLLNPAALGSMMWGTGKFIEGGDPTTFEGRRARHPLPGCASEPVVVSEECSGVLLGRGLLFPETAEIHFVLRDHGPDQEGVEDETTTINGGCRGLLPVFLPGWGTPGEFGCYDAQGTA